MLTVNYTDKYGSQFIYECMVYVMNSDGKTVAKYDLGGWPVPEKVTQTLSGPKGGMGLQGASAL